MAEANWWDSYPDSATAPPSGVTASPAPAGNWWDSYPDSAPSTAPSTESSSLGYSAGVLAGVNPPVSEADKYVANARAGLSRIPGTIGGLPHSIGALGDFLGSKLGASPDPGFLTRHTYSPDDITAGLQKADADINPMFGLLPPQPLYKPETFWGKVGQDTLASAPLAAAGPGSLLAGQGLNLVGNTAIEGAKDVFPNAPGMQLVAGLLAPFLTHTAFNAGQAVVGGAKNLAATKGVVEEAATKNLLNAAGMPRDDIASAINQNIPNWQFPNQSVQPSPTTATVTQIPGLLDYTYKDQAKSPTPYRENASTTNAAQREAVVNATPDNGPQLVANQDLLKNQISGLPSGMSAQEAGSNFRQNLQGVYDQRLQNRQTLGDSVFDQLDSSPAIINLRGVMDYATEQAAKNAGEIGSAYNASLGQFRSATGLTLDTAPFANSVLKGLGDLAQNYPKGSAANRAVLDIKNRAEDAIFDQEPAIAGARQTYAAASEPLDVFNPKKNHTPGPIANAVATTRFGGYITPNDAVVSQFLRGNGSADAIDNLTKVFGDVKSATQPLQDYIASQVQAKAIKDGRVDATALQGVIDPYQSVLSKLPFGGIKKQFSDLNSAQVAVDGLQARQKMFDTFQKELGTGKLDSEGNAFYSANKFGNFVKQNQSDLVSAYGKDGAETINQVNRQLQQITQEANSRVPGQSGTPQASHGTGNVMRYLIGEAVGGGIGDITGALMAISGHGTWTGIGLGVAGHVAGVAIPYLRQRLATRIEDVTRKALLDPAFARYLLKTYDPRMPSSTGKKAWDYVQNSLAGSLAPLTNAAP